MQGKCDICRSYVAVKKNKISGLEYCYDCLSDYEYEKKRRYNQTYRAKVGRPDSKTANMSPERLAKLREANRRKKRGNLPSTPESLKRRRDAYRRRKIHRDTSKL